MGYVPILVSTILITICRGTIAVEVGSKIRVRYKEQYQPVAKAVQQILAESPQPMLTLVVRLAWHTLANYNAALYPKGGSTGGCIRMLPESADGANKNTESARTLLDPVMAEFPFITYADLFILAGNTAFEMMGSLPLYFTPGRVDYPNMNPTPNPQCVPEGRMPKKHISYDVFPFPEGRLYHNIKFRELGFSIVDTMGAIDEDAMRASVALMGGHTTGGMHPSVSGNEGHWTKTPYVFNNEYFIHLNGINWTTDMATNRTDIDLQYEHDGVVMLPSDLTMRLHPDLAEVVREFAINDTSFQLVFAEAWVALTMNGVTPVPGDDLLPTPAPSGTFCTPSTLQQEGNQTYVCMHESLWLPFLSLHWTYNVAEDALYMAVRSETTGWLGMSFPTAAGVMTPADAVIASADGVLPYSIKRRSLSGVQHSELTRAILGLSGESVEQLQGTTTLRFMVKGSAVIGTNGLVAINIARDDRDLNLGRHNVSSVTSMTWDPSTGKVNELAQNLSFYRKLHAALMIAAFCYLLPAGVLIKRYGKAVYGVSDAPTMEHMGCMMKVHIALTVLSLVFCYVAVLVGTLHFPESTESKGQHKLVGYVLVVLSMLLPTLGSLRIMLRGTGVSHAVLGWVFMLAALLQCFSGHYTYDSVSSDSAPLFIAMVTGIVTFVLIYFVFYLIVGSQYRTFTVTDISDQTLINWRELVTHDESSSEPWIVINNTVYSIASWLQTHPGGPEVLLPVAGGDGTAAFASVQHSRKAIDILEKYKIGRLHQKDGMTSILQQSQEISTAVSELNIPRAASVLTEGKQTSMLLEALGILIQKIRAVSVFVPMAVRPLGPADCILPLRIGEEGAIMFIEPFILSVYEEEVPVRDIYVDIVRHAFLDFSGYESKSIENTFLAVFESSNDACRCALAIQERLHDAPWPDAIESIPTYSTSKAFAMRGPCVRIGIHWGEPCSTTNNITERRDFFGAVVNKTQDITNGTPKGSIAVSDLALRHVFIKGYASIGFGSLAGMNVTLIMPKKLEARLSYFSQKTRPVVASQEMTYAKQKKRCSSVAQIAAQHERWPCDTGQCATVGYVKTKISNKRDTQLFDQISTMASLLLNTVERTRGVVVSTTGCYTWVSWGLHNTHVSEHDEWSFRFAAIMKSLLPGCVMGLSTGKLQSGNMGTVSQKLVTVVGEPMHSAILLNKCSQELGTVALWNELVKGQKLLKPEFVDWIRPVDTWQVSTSSSKIDVLIYEVRTDDLNPESSVRGHGFICDQWGWSLEYHEAFNEKLVARIVSHIDIYPSPVLAEVVRHLENNTHLCYQNDLVVV